MKKLNKNNKGFSLVELLVVIAIMVVLVGVVAPTLLGNIEKARVSADIQALDSVASAVQVALGDEKANAELMAKANTALKAADYFAPSATAPADMTNFFAVVRENLSDVPAMKGKEATATGTVMYFAVTNEGRVIVWLSTGESTTVPTAATTAPPTTGSVGLVFAKNTSYFVMR